MPAAWKSMLSADAGDGPGVVDQQPFSANIWKIILYFPSSSAARTMPCCAAMPRRPVTASSRSAITTAIHAGTRGSGGDRGEHDQHRDDDELVGERVEELSERA